MKLPDVLCALLVQVFWGLNFVAIKTSLDGFPPLALVALRFAMVASLILPFFRVERRVLSKLLLLSFTMGTLHFTLLVVGISQIDAGTAGVLIQLGVPFATILAIVLYKEKIGPWRVIGLSVAFSGAIVLAGGPTLPSPFPAFIITVAAFAWAISNLIAKKIDNTHPLAVIGWTSFFACPQVALWSALTETGQINALLTAPATAWMGVLYSVLASSIAAYGLWYWLLQRHPVSAVVPFSLLNPVVAVTASTLALSEAITVWKVAGAVLTLSGVAIIFWRQASHDRSAPLPLEEAPQTNSQEVEPEAEIELLDLQTPSQTKV